MGECYSVMMVPIFIQTSYCDAEYYLSYLTWQRVNFCLTNVHIQCTCSVNSMGIDYLIVLYEYLFRYNIRPSPVDYGEDYYLIPKCHYFENLRLCRDISLI